MPDFKSHNKAFNLNIHFQVGIDGSTARRVAAICSSTSLFHCCSVRRRQSGAKYSLCLNMPCLAITGLRIGNWTSGYKTCGQPLTMGESAPQPFWRQSEQYIVPYETARLSIKTHYIFACVTCRRNLHIHLQTIWLKPYPTKRVATISTYLGYAFIHITNNKNNTSWCHYLIIIPAWNGMKAIHTGNRYNYT